MNSLEGGGSLVTEQGLTLSGRCSVTLCIMLSVSQAEISGLWLLELLGIDSTSSGNILEQTLILEPRKCGGEANVLDSLVGVAAEVRGFAWMPGGTAGAAGICRAVGR